mmetsp:Transcript_53237/g.155034  ORF Transcript_53237/g.155034 Transcript_53237/m.155034 type:complete len:200 (-) Transcript_53237:1038-1637(-)
MQAHARASDSGWPTRWKCSPMMATTATTKARKPSKSPMPGRLFKQARPREGTSMGSVFSQRSLSAGLTTEEYSVPAISATKTMATPLSSRLIQSVSFCRNVTPTIVSTASTAHLAAVSSATPSRWPREMPWIFAAAWSPSSALYSITTASPGKALAEGKRAAQAKWTATTENSAYMARRNMPMMIALKVKKSMDLSTLA